MDLTYHYLVLWIKEIPAYGLSVGYFRKDFLDENCSPKSSQETDSCLAGIGGSFDKKIEK